MIGQDLRYAVRMLRTNLLVTSTIVVTLALGIGANTAIFSVLNAVVLRTLPVPDAGQLFAVAAPRSIAPANRFSGPMVDRLRASAPEGVVVAAQSRVAQVYTRLDGDGDIEPASLQLVSANHFYALGVPIVGRQLPDEHEAAATASPAAIVSHAFWQRRLGAAPDAIGRRLNINGGSFTIVGIGPPGFVGVWLESPVDLWVPLTLQGVVKYTQNYSADGADWSRPWLQQDRVWWLEVIVRTAPERVAAVTAALNAGLPPRAAPGASLTLQSFDRGFSIFRQRFARPLVALTVMAALVLLVACANVANLLLARAAGRQREIAIRMSMGAGRMRVFHQLLTESLLLVTMAGAAALLFARWAGDLLVRTATAPAGGAAPFAAAVDLRVLAFAAGLALASVVLFGVVPAWRTTRLDLVGALKAGARGTVGGVRPARALVVLQVALSLVLVTGTGLLVRGFERLLHVDVGFDRDRLLSVTIDPRLAGVPAEEYGALARRVRDRVAAVPGVAAASLAMCGVQSGCRAREDGFAIEGYAPVAGEKVEFVVNAVDDAYFSTLGMRLVAGRGFDDRDRGSKQRVAIVNRALASRYFENEQAVGRRFGDPTPDVEIIGVVEDARLLNVKDSAEPSAFFPLSQRGMVTRYLEVRTNSRPESAFAAIRAAIREAAPGLPIEGMRTADDRISRSLSQERVIVFLASGFGALALGLAGFGLFGVLSYAVARRSAEFGIRMALGASRGRVLWGVVREALLLVVVGLAIGAPFVIYSGRLLSSFFGGVSTADWPTIAAATLVLVTVGGACSLLPALRAARVDPVVALRQE